MAWVCELHGRKALDGGLCVNCQQEREAMTRPAKEIDLDAIRETQKRRKSALPDDYPCWFDEDICALPLIRK